MTRLRSLILIVAALTLPAAAHALSLAELAAAADAVLIADRGTPPRLSDNSLTGCPERLALVTVSELLDTKPEPPRSAVLNRNAENQRKAALLALKSAVSLTVRMNPAEFHACHAKKKTRDRSGSAVPRYAPSDLHWQERGAPAVFFLHWDRDTFELAADDAVEPVEKAPQVRAVLKK
jgi:hypothetical protein